MPSGIDAGKIDNSIAVNSFQDRTAVLPGAIADIYPLITAHLKLLFEIPGQARVGPCLSQNLEAAF